LYSSVCLNISGEKAKKFDFHFESCCSGTDDFKCPVIRELVLDFTLGVTVLVLELEKKCSAWSAGLCNPSITAVQDTGRKDYGKQAKPINYICFG
jgi:hypothetical protein